MEDRHLALLPTIFIDAGRTAEVASRNLTPNEHKMFRDSQPPKEENAIIECSSSLPSQDVEERDVCFTEGQLAALVYGTCR